MVAEMIPVSAILGRMKRKDSVTVSQKMEGLDRVPVMEVEEIKPFLPVVQVKLVYHRMAHSIAVIHNIGALGTTVVIVDPFDDPVVHLSAGEEVYFMLA
jgi:hypothetical protein